MSNLTPSQRADLRANCPSRHSALNAAAHYVAEALYYRLRDAGTARYMAERARFCVLLCRELRMAGR